MEATIKTLATKDDLTRFQYHLNQKISNSAKWMFVFSIANLVQLWRYCLHY